MRDPSVSVPKDTIAMLAATDIADPLLEPHGFPSFTRIVSLLAALAHHPSGIRGDRKWYHSLMLAFPRITAPALLSRSTTPASRGGTDPSSANDPAVVFISSRVAMLSFKSTGTPCNGGRPPLPASLSRSAASAWSSASGLTSITPRSAGFKVVLDEPAGSELFLSERAAYFVDCGFLDREIVAIDFEEKAREEEEEEREYGEKRRRRFASRHGLSFSCYVQLCRSQFTGFFGM
ncbi:heat shock 70 kDa protein [Striga asiatica]|uniref:Heat shock 70 kDa protein n=1 Tax=Striga asiatica TaxID=4170 RepID=A0A5A7QYZ6_STRAF|nr:heat shock 70 kDa protein [Striga asiatica]